MKKTKLFFFIAGMLTAFLIMFLINLGNQADEELTIIPEKARGAQPLQPQQLYEELTIFPEKGDYISKNQFKVFQVIEPTMALASELSFSNEAGEFYNGIIVLLINDEGTQYYDDEIIKIPSDKGARLIGTFKYRTKQEIYKTVPVVRIE